MSQTVENRIRAAKARAMITSYLSTTGGVITPDQLLPVVQNLNYTMSALMQVIGRMVTSGLVSKHIVTHPDYKYGYAFSRDADEPMQRKTAPRKVKSKEHPTPTQIDIVMNEENRSVTINYGGMSITVSKGT